MKDIDAFLNSVKLKTDDPRFFQKVFSQVSKVLKAINAKSGDNLKRVIMEEYGSLSHRADKSKFQESCSIRNVLRTRRLANLLINDEGELNLSLLPTLHNYLKQYCYVLGPERQFDAPRNEHLLNVIEKLLQDKNIQRQLKLISKPTSHKTAEQIIRDTLVIPPNEPLTDAHARRAALSSWMCYLRQNVGSCFATAPAIVVQKEQPELFLKDLSELLATGRLKRTFGGIEYAVPLSSSWGAGDLRKVIGIDRLDKEAVENIALSPGILNALEAAKIIDAEKPLPLRGEEAKKIVQDAIYALSTDNQPYILISAEEIIRYILMRHFGISAKDVEDYENRMKGMLHTGMIQMAVSSVKGRKGEAVASFLTHFDLAKNAFKALSDNALLKTWEFTLASFAETKPGFTRWNMYASLGFNAEERGGIADCLYQEIKTKLDQSNRKVQDTQFEYEQVYNSLKYIEARMRSVSSEKEAQWVKVEYESRRNEFRTLEEIRDREHFKSKRYANLLNDLLEAYDKLFPEYFQEVYDADMHEVTSGPYDDSPAGFRLLYKHGRANTSLWTLIYTPEEFIENLSAFFVATETQIVNDPEFEGLQEDISEIVTKLVTLVKTDQFLESAFHRMAIAHNAPLIKDPLHHLEKIEKKPWAYTSGGGMSNLMSCYFKLEGKPTEQQRWVENEMELLVFLIEVAKQIPPKIAEEYLNKKDRYLLMHSPTHAFNLKPSFPLFKEAIMTESFPFTWVRDHLVKPPETFIEYMFLDLEMMQFLIQKLTAFVPTNFKPRFKTVFSHISGKKNAREFRQYLVEMMDKDRGLQIGRRNVLDEDIIDSGLFTWLPLFSPQEIKNRCEQIFQTLPGLSEPLKQELSEIVEEMTHRLGDAPFISARQLQDICKAALCMALNVTSTPIDYPYHVSLAAQKLGYAFPTPILFADTNWVKENFAFLVNPGTGKLDFWRMDYTGSEGVPMSIWKQWLDGSNKERTWGVFVKPYEYKANIS